MTELPETFAIEVVDEVLPDLIEVVRNPYHPDADALLARAKKTIFDSFDITEPGFPDYDFGWVDGAAQSQFDTLLAVAETGFRLGWWS